MECAEVREFLSEYTLDGELKADVDKHLLSCKACREEAVLLKELGSLKEVKAPEDFLEKVHERLARRFEFKKIAQLLFFPLRIKIPLELATAVATVILASYIFKPAERILQPPLVTESAIVAKSKEVARPAPVLKVPLPGREEEESVGLALKEKKVVLPTEGRWAMPTLQEEKAALLTDTTEELPLPGKETEAIELALLIRPEDVPAIYKLKEQARGIDRKGVGKALRAPAEEASIISDEKRFHLVSEVFSKIRNFVGLVDGKIISEEYGEGSTLPQFLTVEIPAKNYNLLLEKLGQLGRPMEILPSKTEKKRELLKLRITVALGWRP